jgi:Ser/Thr protein kinase RdoA (MazF antagonist)
VAAPDPLLTLDGDDFAEVAVPATEERRWCGLARWVDGEMLADVVARETELPAKERHFTRLGAIIATMHDQATSWTLPAGFRRHAVDADGLMGPEPFWGPFWDHDMLSPAERSLLLNTRDALHHALTRYGKPGQTFSLIHADLHPRNVVINGTHAAVIDFDDTGFGWHQYDLAVALVSYQDHPEFPAFRDACIAGYRSVRALAEQDLALLPMFQLIRDMVQVGWFHQRPELPRSPTLLRSKDRACSVAARFVPVVLTATGWAGPKAHIGSRCFSWQIAKKGAGHVEETGVDGVGNSVAADLVHSGNVGGHAEGHRGVREPDR